MNNLDYDNLSIDELAMAINLDKEERELLDSIENDEWVSISNEKEEIGVLKSMINKFTKSNKKNRVRIRYHSSYLITKKFNNHYPQHKSLYI